jgi:hypothetical protein
MYFPFFIIDFYNSWKRTRLQKAMARYGFNSLSTGRVHDTFQPFLGQEQKTASLGHNEKREVEWPRGDGTTLTTVLKEST